MRVFFAAVLAALLVGCAAHKPVVVPPKKTPNQLVGTKTEVPVLRLYEVLPDATEKKTLRGILSKELITKDTAFDWYAANLKYFKPNADAVTQVREKAEKISIIIFGGTWCHDTQQLLPKYFATLDAAAFPENKLTIIGVDRNKTTVGDLHKVFNITNVPTLIVMKEGKEVGRIVEFGKTALVDQELGTMLHDL